MGTAVAAHPFITVRHFWSGEGNLSYLLTHTVYKKAVLIDPDLEILGQYLLTLDKEQLQLAAILDTHTHAEHATAAPALMELTGAPYVMNQHAPSSFITHKMADGQAETFGGIPLRFIHTPGHTPDMQTIQLGEHLFTGDCLFNQSSGRPDLPGGDAVIQFASLQRLTAFPDETMIHPGHDYTNTEASRLGAIRTTNPRLLFEDAETFSTFMAEYYALEEKPDDLEYYVAFNAR